jgi:hypothetical protein
LISRRITKHRTGRRFITAFAVTGLVAGSLLATGVALAATGPGQNFFELDASLDQSNGAAPKAAINDPIVGDDWDQVAAGTSGANATSFDSETTATGSANNATIFTGGGSKDKLPIEGWGWKDAAGGLPDKDNLLHAMSARYGAGATAHIYFAADRFDNSGDAQIGFWFLNQQVGPVAGGGFSGSHTAGTVPHSVTQPGDVLILSDFTNGGTQPTIRVYEYVGSGGSEGSLNLLGGTATDVRDCGTVSTDDFCGSVNNFDGAVAPWLYLNKSGQSTFGHGEFYEGGINLASLGLQNECFSSFLAETRSSQSVTATLKDFVSGPFQSCTAGVTTTPKDGAGASIPATGIAMETDGTLAVKDSAVVTVGGATTWSGTVTFFLCGPIASPGLCTTGGVQIGNPVAVNQGSTTALSAAASVTSAGRYCWRGFFDSATTGVPDSTDATSGECFTVNPVTPTLSTDASDSVVLGNAITDTATIGGTAVQPGTNGGNTTYPTINATNGLADDGSISWIAYGPDSCTQVSGFAESRTIAGDGTYPTALQTAVGFTPTAIGTYTFAASYTSGSANTNSVAALACADQPTGEQVTVTGSSSLSTAQDWLPNDTATLTGDANLNGSLVFTLYNDLTCGAGGGTSQYTETVTVTNADGSGTGTDFSTANTLIKVSATGSYSWKVSYTDDNLSSPSDSCETTDLTITN